MPIAYKMHLFSPGSSTMTLCGRKLRGFSTHSPQAVTCKQCLGSYVGNVAWYWSRMNSDPPKLKLFLNEDEPFPELVVIRRRRVPGRIDPLEVIYLELRK